VNKFLIPIIFFVLVGILLAYGLTQDPRKIPSPLIDKPLPDFTLATVADEKVRVSKTSLLGRVYLLNVWASWCVACKQEHPLLMALARSGQVPIIGLNYKDERQAALQELASQGNPYELSLADNNGRLGIELGVYGVPETFLIDAQGIIRYKHVGPVTAEILESVVLPRVKALKNAG
jgi:cytochrome c biogenesis protein CcmG/thiol:disulfide interchange protein DsbE